MPGHFATTLADAIAAQPLTLERISARLKQAGTPASVTTLSYWQTGRSIPTRAKSRACLAELDHILELEPGTLARALDSSAPSWTPESIPTWEPAQSMLDDLGVSLRRTWTTLHSEHSLFLDDRGHETSELVRILLRADVDGAQTWPIVLSQDTTMEGAVAGLRAVSGVEITDVRYAPAEHVTVGVASLPFPVARGTVVSIEYEILWGAQSDRAYRLGACLASDSGSMTFTVRFQGETPARFQRYFSPLGPGTTTYTDDVLAKDTWAQVALLEPAAGEHGICWAW